MAAIANTELTNTWEFWRQRQNEVASRLSSIADGLDKITMTNIELGGHATLAQTLNANTTVTRLSATSGGLSEQLNIDVRSIRHTAGNSFEDTETRIEYNVDDDADKRMWISFYNDSVTATNNNMRFGEGASTEWARFEDGLFGIGTIAPTATLDVNGNAIVSGTITGGTITDGATTLTAGAITGVGSITANNTGTITANTITATSTFTDGVATLSGGNITGAVSITATSFTGDGSALTDINANNITTGTLADARIPATITRDAELSETLNIRNSANSVIKAIKGLPG